MPIVSGTTRSAALMTSRYAGSERACMAISLPNVTTCAKRCCARSCAIRCVAASMSTGSTRDPRMRSGTRKPICGQLARRNRRSGGKPRTDCITKRAHLIGAKLAERRTTGSRRKAEHAYRCLDGDGGCDREQRPEERHEALVYGSRALVIALSKGREHLRDV